MSILIIAFPIETSITLSHCAIESESTTGDVHGSYSLPRSVSSI